MTMTPVERWMLPDGIEEILPPEAQQVEQLRRCLLDLLGRWGYELVIPPMMEFTDSLLVGLAKDVDLLTFRVTDQLSGRSMGIHADMTPQIARIDAHSLNRRGVNRLCYVGHVLQTQMKSALDTRSPMQIGVEFFGEPGLEADAEVTSLLLDVMQQAQIQTVCLDLGHVAIYRALAQAAKLSSTQETEFFELLQAKALTEIAQWVTANVADPQAAGWLLELPRLAGGIKALDNARRVLAGAPREVFGALDELESIASLLAQRFPNVQLYFDLSELTGYHYLTGLVFTVFVPGHGSAIARGGRYDHIGEVFGRSRSATGFTADLVAIHRLRQGDETVGSAVFAPFSEDPLQWQAIQELRDQGNRVVHGTRRQAKPLDYQACDRVLVYADGIFQVKSL